MKIAVSLTRESPEAWRAWVPELPGCAARGKSQQDVERKIDQAIRGYLASWNIPELEDLEEEMVEVGPPEPRSSRSVS